MFQSRTSKAILLFLLGLCVITLGISFNLEELGTLLGLGEESLAVLTPPPIKDEDVQNGVKALKRLQEGAKKEGEAKTSLEEAKDLKQLETTKKEAPAKTEEKPKETPTLEKPKISLIRELPLEKDDQKLKTEEPLEALNQTIVDEKTEEELQSLPFADSPSNKPAPDTALPPLPSAQAAPSEILKRLKWTPIKTSTQQIEKILLLNEGVPGITRIEIKSTSLDPNAVPVRIELQFSGRLEEKKDEPVVISPSENSNYLEAFPTFFPEGPYEALLTLFQEKPDSRPRTYVVPLTLGDTPQEGALPLPNVLTCKKWIAIEMNHLVREAKWISTAQKQKESAMKASWLAPVVGRLSSLDPEFQTAGAYRDPKTQSLLLMLLDLRRRLLEESQRMLLPSHEKNPSIEWARWSKTYQQARALYDRVPCQATIQNTIVK